MTDMIPRLSLPLRLKLSFVKLKYMNGYFLSWKYAIIYASLIYGVVHINIFYRTGVSFVQLKLLFFFHTLCDPHTEMLLEI